MENTRSINDFLQVSIDTSKLVQFFSEVNNSSALQAAKFEELSRRFDELSTHMSQNQSVIQSKFEQLVAEQQKLRQADISLATWHSAEVKSIKAQIQAMNDLLAKNRLEIQETMKLTTQSSESKGKVYVDESLAVKTTDLREEIARNAKTIQEECICIINAKLQEEDDCLEMMASPKKKAKQASDGQKPAPMIQKIDRRVKTNKNIAHLHLASIAAKLEELEAKICNKDTTPLNRVLYSRPNQLDSRLLNFDHNSNEWSVGPITGKNSAASKSTPYKQIQEHFKELENSMATSLNELRAQIKNIDQVHKVSIIEDKIDVLNRKVDKEKLKVSEVGLQIKRFEERRTDERVIEGLRAQIKMISNELEFSLNNMVRKESFEGQKTKVQERLNIIQENLVEKAEKEETKHAVVFLEDKIKQIILLVANGYNGQKDGAAKRTPFKCLSCDRDLETQIKQNQGTLKCNTKEIATSRCNSSLRKRIKLNAVTSSMPASIMESDSVDLH